MIVGTQVFFWLMNHSVAVLLWVSIALACGYALKRVRRARRMRRILSWDPHVHGEERARGTGRRGTWQMRPHNGWALRRGGEKELGNWVGSPVVASVGRGRRGESAGRRLALIIIEVAARLRTGTPTGLAWKLAWQRHEKEKCGSVDDRGIPSRLEEYASLREESGIGGWVREHLSAGNADASSCRQAARAVIASCTMSYLLGCPLAEVLDAVADGIEQNEEAENARRIAGAGPALSARILSVLPFLGVLAAEFLGAHPLRSYLDAGVGSACFLVGMTCMVCGHMLSRFLQRRARQVEEPRSGVDAAMLCDLTLSALRSGAAVPTTLIALGKATRCDELVYAGKQLKYGSSWEAAWEGCPPETALISYALEPAWCDGTSPENLLRRCARHLRSTRLADAQAEAEKLSVQLVAPLGIFMLPAFIALGVIPVFLSLIQGTLG